MLARNVLNQFFNGPLLTKAQVCGRLVEVTLTPEWPAYAGELIADRKCSQAALLKQHGQGVVQALTGDIKAAGCGQLKIFPVWGQASNWLLKTVVRILARFLVRYLVARCIFIIR